MIEIIVVVMIVLVLAAISIPSLLHAREVATEASATGALRTITVGQVTYFALYQGYAPSLAALGPPKRGGVPSAIAADLIDEQLATGEKGGYRFRYSAIDVDGDGLAEAYLVVAEPSRGGARRAFFVDQTGAVSSVGSEPDREKPGTVGGEPK